VVENAAFEKGIIIIIMTMERERGRKGLWGFPLLALTLIVYVVSATDRSKNEHRVNFLGFYGI